MQSKSTYSVQSSNPTDFFQAGEEHHTYQKYLAYVKKIAKEVHAATCGHLNLDDLTSAGLYGLYQAMQNFDDSYGTPFLSYCQLRIRGEMYDDLRRNDWIPRQVRKEHIQCQQAETRLRAHLCRKPTMEELSHETDLSQKAIDRFARMPDIPKIFSYNQAVPDDDSDTIDCVHLIDNQSARPEEIPEQEDNWNRLISCLNRTEKLVMTFYYREELTLSQIGLLMGLSESRICQIHGQAIKRLKSFLKKDKIDPTSLAG